MKTHIKLIIGLPASGKTFYLNGLDDSWYKVDDPQDLSIFPRNVSKIAVADPNFCLTHTLEKSKVILREMYGDVSFEEVYFENSPEKCERNVVRRNDGRKVGMLIKMLSKKYTPPDNAIKIYDGE